MEVSHSSSHIFEHEEHFCTCALAHVCAVVAWLVAFVVDGLGRAARMVCALGILVRASYVGKRPAIATLVARRRLGFAWALRSRAWVGCVLMHTPQALVRVDVFLSESLGVDGPLLFAPGFTQSGRPRFTTVTNPMHAPC